MGQLADWAEKQSPFLRIQPGESKRVIWTGEFKEVEDTFNPGQFKMRYSFKVQDGSSKIFETSSIYFAMQMDKLRKGADIIISRVGEGRNTQWSVEKASGIEGQPQVKEELTPEQMAEIDAEVKPEKTKDSF